MTGYYDKWDESELKVARRDWERNLRDASRDYDRAKGQETIRSADSRTVDARQQLVEIERALLARRQQRRSHPPATSPPATAAPGRVTSPRPRTSQWVSPRVLTPRPAAASAVFPEKSTLQDALSGWCRRNRIGTTPTFLVEVHWTIDGRRFLGHFDYLKGDLNVLAEVRDARSHACPKFGSAQHADRANRRADCRADQPEQHRGWLYLLPGCWPRRWPTPVTGLAGCRA
jgi:hypothetical protein